MFISHGHDAYVADAIAIAKQSDCCCIGSWETEGWLQKTGKDLNSSQNRRTNNTLKKWVK